MSKCEWMQTTPRTSVQTIVVSKPVSQIVVKAVMPSKGACNRDGVLFDDKGPVLATFTEKHGVELVTSQIQKLMQIGTA